MFWPTVGVIFGLIVVAAVLFVILRMVNRKSAEQGADVAGGWITHLFGKLFNAKGNPIKVMKFKCDQFATAIEDGWNVMEEKQAIIMGLQRSIDSDEKEVIRLEALAQQALGNKNDAEAKDYLTQKVRIDRRLKDNLEKIKEEREEYEENRQDLESNQRKLANTRQEIKQLGVDVKMSQATARVLKKMPNLDGMTTGMDAAREAAHEEIDMARAQSQVARDRRRNQRQQEKLEMSADEAEAQKLLDAMKKG